MTRARGPRCANEVSALAEPEGEESLRCRVFGEVASPTVVYLPGIHGDWTLVGALRHAIGPGMRWVEFTYPRSVTWSLRDYASAIDRALGKAGIEGGWLLAESFGSQVAWAMAGTPGSFRIEGILLAGGFGEHPYPRLVRLARWLAVRFPESWLRQALNLYRFIARWRFRAAPDLAADMDEFVRRRTPADRAALIHRLGLILNENPTEWARQVSCPVHYLTGFWDPVVPWPHVPGWLRTRCRDFRGWRCLMTADHNVLSSAARQSAAVIRGWISA